MGQEKTSLEPLLKTTIRLGKSFLSRSRALDEMTSMAAKYGFDISRPALQCPGGCSVALLRLPCSYWKTTVQP